MIKCTNCNKELSNTNLINCPNCNALICNDCAKGNAMLCPHCYSEVNFNS